MEEKHSNSPIRINSINPPIRINSINRILSNIYPSNSKYDYTNFINCDNIKSIFSKNDPTIDSGILRLIIEYLNSSDSFNKSTKQLVSNLLTDEYNLNQTINARFFAQLQKVVLEGDWIEAEKLVLNINTENNISKISDDKNNIADINNANRNMLHYLILKQQYLEYIDQMDFQSAFVLLHKKLLLLQNSLRMGSGIRTGTSNFAFEQEFADFALLLLNKPVTSVKSFRNWERPPASRERLVQEINSFLQASTFLLGSEVEPINENQEPRLITLLKYAMLFQLHHDPYIPDLQNLSSQFPQNRDETQAKSNDSESVVDLLPQTKLKSLFVDYHTFVIPNTCFSTLTGHTKDIKCINFFSPNLNNNNSNQYLVSGSSDHSVKIWDIEQRSCIHTLTGHRSRIWSLASPTINDCSIVASGSGDGTINIWKPLEQHGSLKESLICGSDVYSINFHPNNYLLISGCYDSTLRLFDTNIPKEISQFKGHKSSVTSVFFDQSYNNLIISGSKDCSVKFWDMLSGYCISSLSFSDEITSLDIHPTTGTSILVSQKNHCLKTVDIRTGNTLQTYKGNLNTSHSFLRYHYANSGDTIIGGSEDGMIYIWDTLSGSLLKTLKAHQDICIMTAWNTANSILASCSHDATVKLWNYSPTSFRSREPSSVHLES